MGQDKWRKTHAARLPWTVHPFRWWTVCQRLVSGEPSKNPTCGHCQRALAKQKEKR